MPTAIVFSMIIFLSPYLLRKKFSISDLSGLAATFGIFGTFIGIFLGLREFNVFDLSNSVPNLLEGLKIAFLTSISGMLAGIIIKIFPGFYLIKTEKDTSEEASMERMINLLYEVTTNQKELFTKEHEQLKNIEKALCGDGDTTLLTQIQKLRTTTADKHDELKKEFQEFAKNMAENNSKSLVEALTQVMRDFNTKINEQFGENFKHLNEGVGRMLVWQEQYKQQVEKMVEQFERTLKGVETSERSLEKIINDAKQFSEIAESLKKLLELMNSERTKMHDNLKAFSEMAENAKSAFPIINQEITKLTKDFSKKVEDTTKELSTSISKQKEALEEQGKVLSKTQNEVNTQLVKISTDIGGQIQKLMSDNAERITKQVTELDKELGKELEKSLQSLGNQLASLSQKFVNDYTPLTEKLREIINLSKAGK